MIITIIVMLILVAVTVNLANEKGGLFVTTRKAASETQAAAEKETLSAELVGAIKAGGEFDISAVNLPDNMKWCDEGDNDFNSVNKEHPSKGEASWVITKNNNKFYVNKNGNLSDTASITWEEARTSKWYAVEEKGDIVISCGVNEKNISLTQTINNVPVFEEITIGEKNGSPITEMKFKEYKNIDITGEKIYITFTEKGNIEQVNLNGLNVNLESECFTACSNLVSVTGLEGISQLPDYAFDGCGKLTDITLPNNIISIGHNTFNDCSSLTNITIPSSVTSIDSSTFGYCTNLTQITINKAQDSISGAPWGAPNATVTWQG